MSKKQFDKVELDFDDSMSSYTVDGTSIDATEVDFYGDMAALDDLIAAGELTVAADAVVDCGEVEFAAGVTGAVIGFFAGIFDDLAIVNASCDPTGGGHTTGSGLYFAGTSVLVTATPNSSWRFTGWSDGGNTINHWVTAPYNGTANFIQQSTVTVLANPAEDAGTVTGGGTYDVGTSVALTATAEEGWEFSDWNGNEEDTNRILNITVPPYDVTYTANFEVEVEGEAEPPTGGFILGNGSYPQGTWVPLLATPYVGWRFTGWFLEADSTNSTWLTNITTVIVAANPLTPPLKYKAHFEQLVMVTGLANPTNAGSVDGSGTYDVDDTNITLTATASNNWVFVKWNDGTTNNPYTVTVPPILVMEDIYTNIICTASFAATATITVEANPTNGGAVTGGGTFLVGSTNLITAVASNGWAFTGWSDGYTNHLHSIVVTSNQTYTADFTQISIVTGLANPTNAGIVIGGGVYFVGSNAVLTATASNVWRFINWNDGTTNNPYSITVPDTNITYTANFAATAVITVGANPNIGGSVTGGGTFLVGSTNLITASVSTSWLFMGWNDGTTANHYYIIVPATNTTFTAGFTAGNSTNILISVSGESLTLAWPADHLGWILQALTNDLSSTNWFDLPGTGDTNLMVIPMNPANPEVFYRLRQP